MITVVDNVLELHCFQGIFFSAATKFFFVASEFLRSEQGLNHMFTGIVKLAMSKRRTVYLGGYLNFDTVVAIIFFSFTTWSTFRRVLRLHCRFIDLDAHHCIWSVHYFEIKRSIMIAKGAPTLPESTFCWSWVHDSASSCNHVWFIWWQLLSVYARVLYLNVYRLNWFETGFH